MPVHDARVELRIPEDLIRKVDEKRGLVPRAAWIRAAMENALEDSAPVKASAPAQKSAPPSAPKPSRVPSVDPLAARQAALNKGKGM